MTDRVHEPVMVEEVLSLLAPKPGEVMVDLTVGAGGHAEAILDRMGLQGVVIGLDRDAEAIEVARARLARHGERAILAESCADRFPEVLERSGVVRVDGILMDLGVSSMQLDQPSRGFSFRKDGPLDMRMSPGTGATALDLLLQSTAEELERIFRDYGDEPSARRIAGRIKDLVGKRPPRTTLELAYFIESLRPRRIGGRSSIHPATRIFQALRIAVNDELGQIERTLPLAEAHLAPGGRLAVIAFHSAEDRLVKNFMRDGIRAGRLAGLTGRPATPSAAEAARNPRSRSARLRACRTPFPGETLP